MDKYSKTSDTDILETIDIEDDTPKKSKVGKIIALIVCFLAAIIIWLYVAQTDDTTYEKTLRDVDILVTSAEGQSYTLSENTVDIVVEGYRRNLATIEDSDLTVYIDISSLTIGEHDVHISVTTKDTSGLSLVSQSQETVRVTVQ